MTRPEPGEYHEYYGRYIDLVPEGDVLKTLAAQMEETRALLASVPADREEYRYAPGKWSVREVVGHVLDTERVFAFRCLWVARGAQGGQPGMEQDDWAAASNAGARPLAELVDEWVAARTDHLHLLRGLDEVAWTRTGIASGRPFTARAFPWIMAGHELHHRGILERDYGLGGAR